MTEFDRTTALRREGDADRFHVELDGAWSSLRGVHGGYLNAIAVAAAEAVAPDRNARTATTTFLRPAAPGAAVVEVAMVRAGRMLSTARVTVRQGEREIAESRITLTAGLAGDEWDTSDVVDLPPIDQCVPLNPPEGVLHFGRATAVLDPRFIPFSHGPLARVGGYVRPLEPRPIDSTWLAMILDWFPPSPFTRRDPPIGGVSIDLTVHLHRTLPTLADGEWLSATFDAPVSTGGLALEHGRVRDPRGRLLAESFHTRLTVAAA